MLILGRELYDEMVDHALAAATVEVCGLLGGAFDQRESRAEMIEPATNVAPAPEYEYAIDPTEQLDLMTAIEAEDREVVGFYHSHPQGPPQPSAADAERATWPDRSYVIIDVSGTHPVVGAWRWDGEADRFVREVLTVQ